MFKTLRIGAVNLSTEAKRLSELYQRAANWLQSCADQWVIRDHVDLFFVEQAFREPARQHTARARQLGGRAANSGLSPLREYRRLAGLFDAQFSSFERKKFVNLSHEANKAMNLNSYLGLMGRHWRFSYQDNNQYLESSNEEHADLSLPDSQYVLTLDADSILLNDYTLRLVNVMEAPGNEQVAVAQTPYSAFPGAKTLLERTAGATTDIQYFVHQGFTHFEGTYWVGANALIRRQALHDLALQRSERGFPVTVYVQDRTVIEDTKSSIDLVVKGWSLYNYPRRLAYSATPADFGSLLIQRRRWANGGLIILPKLLRHLLTGSRRTNFTEGFLRIHYLISLATTGVAILFLLLLPFEQGLRSIWLPLAAAPYFLLYGRDLLQAGYSWKDLLGVYALNLLLVPVHLGGVLKSLQQAVTGHKTPFGRTPKVTTRTTVPPLYLWATASLLVLSIVSACIGFADGHWVRFAFSLMNTIVFIFVVSIFIGLREFVEDAFAWHPRLQTGLLRLFFRTQEAGNRSVIGALHAPLSFGPFPFGIEALAQLGSSAPVSSPSRNTLGGTPTLSNSLQCALQGGRVSLTQRPFDQSNFHQVPRDVRRSGLASEPQWVLMRFTATIVLWCSLQVSVGCHAALAELAHEQTIPVLVYHQISTPEHPLAVKNDVIKLADFSEEMEHLHSQGYQTISTARLIDFMVHGTSVPEKAVVIHFDDGWRSVSAALPILERYGFKAAFWIIAGKGIGGDYFDWNEIVALSQNPNYEIYSHTMTHPWDPENNLVTWAEGKTPGRGISDVYWELKESKRILENKLGQPVPYLAWPIGAYNGKLIAAATRAGYSALFTIEWGRNGIDGDVRRVRRAYVSGSCKIADFHAILQEGRSRDCDATLSRVGNPDASSTAEGDQ